LNPRDPGARPQINMTLPVSHVDNTASDGLSIGAKVGIGVGVGFGAIAIFGGLFIFLRKQVGKPAPKPVEIEVEERRDVHELESKNVDRQELEAQECNQELAGKTGGS
jgi:hypothetical protein